MAYRQRRPPRKGRSDREQSFELFFDVIETGSGPVVNFAHRTTLAFPAISGWSLAQATRVATRVGTGRRAQAGPNPPISHVAAWPHVVVHPHVVATGHRRRTHVMTGPMSASGPAQKKAREEDDRDDEHGSSSNAHPSQGPIEPGWSSSARRHSRRARFRCFSHDRVHLPVLSPDWLIEVHVHNQPTYSNTNTDTIPQ